MVISKTEQTILAYDRNAKKYDEKFSVFAPYQEKIVEFKKGYIVPGAQILDLGCGPGNNIATLKSLDDSYSFTGVDLSADLLTIAQGNHPDCSFVQQNICTLELGVQYDTILASFCVVHLTDIETKELIEFISKSLVSGGSLYLSFMKGSSSGFESTSFSEDEIFFNYYQADDIGEMLRESGLEIREITTQDYPEQDGTFTTDIFIFAVNK